MTDRAFIVESWTDYETRRVWYEVVHAATGARYAEGIATRERAIEIRDEIEADIGAVRHA